MKPGVLLTQENADRIGEVIRECLNSADLKACIKKTGGIPAMHRRIRRADGGGSDPGRAELRSAGNEAAAGKSPKELS